SWRPGPDPAHERDSALSGLDANVTSDFGLARQYVALSLVLFGQRILHGHAHTARHELDAARSASPGAAGVIDEDAGFIGRIKDRRTDGNRRVGIRSLKDHLAGDLGRCGGSHRGVALDGTERLRPDLSFSHAQRNDCRPYSV